MKTPLQITLIGVLALTSLLFHGCPMARKEASAPPPPATNAPPGDKGDVYPVWFGTDRKPVAQNQPLGFSAERHDHTTYGRVDVFVPKSHRFGETGNNIFKRLWRGELQDDHLRIKQLESLDREPFYDQIRQALKVATDAGNHSQALVFLHGFNVTFEEAATSGRQRVPSECCNTFWLAVPPPDIAKRFDELTAPLMAKIKANSTQSRTLATLRDTLLPKLLSGELSVNQLESSHA